MNERQYLPIRKELNQATGVDQNLFVSRNSVMSSGSAVLRCELMRLLGSSRNRSIRQRSRLRIR
jgi:hypothetical protein